MSIRNAKLGGASDWSSEELKSTDLNDTFNAASFRPLSNLNLTDNTVVSDTISGASSSYSTKRTLSVGAGVVTNYVIVRFNLRAYASYFVGSPSTNDWSVQITPYAQITIDSVQKFEIAGPASKYESINTSSHFRERTEGRTGMYCFKYTPSSGEKSSGFTIDLDLKSVEAHTGTGTTGSEGSSYNDYWEVWGV